ncbi:MAG: hypothetical protein HOP33_17660 [Verrucomicrobia bacterium]|nr:hypothetical protein [Verrucomicrobiota bacterium]
MNNITLKALSLLALVFLVNGCSTLSRSPAVSDLKSIEAKYIAQSYDACLAEVEAFLKNYSMKTPGWAILALKKAVCYEEMGDMAGADALYRQIVEFVPNTQFADFAKLRLERKAGDQREHFLLDLSGEPFQRGSKLWSRTGMSCTFVPKGQSMKKSDKFILIRAEDRWPEIESPEAVLARFRADAGLAGATMETREVERSENDGIWSVNLSAAKKTPARCGVIRVTATTTRVHMIIYYKNERTISPEEIEYWRHKFKNATLITTK